MKALLCLLVALPIGSATAQPHQPSPRPPNGHQTLLPPPIYAPVPIQEPSTTILFPGMSQTFTPSGAITCIQFPSAIVCN